MFYIILRMENFVNWLKNKILSGIEYIKNSVASGRDWIRENIIDRFQEEEEEEKEEEKENPVITQLDQALQGYAKSYEISIINNKDPLLQLQKTRTALESLISNLLITMNGLKFLEALKVTLSKISDGEIIYNSPVFFSTPQIIINNTEIKVALEATQQLILNKIAILDI